MVGVLDYWSVGLLDGWNIGDASLHHSNAPSIQYSNTPSIRLSAFHLRDLDSCAVLHPAVSDNDDGIANVEAVESFDTVTIGVAWF